MNVPVTVNGVTVEIPVDDKVIQEALKKKKKTGYERVKEGEIYYTSWPGCNSLNSDEEYDDSKDCKLYAEANYYSDVNVAENNIRADTLMRELRRFAAEHGGAVAPFADKEGFYLFWDDFEGKVDYFDTTCPTAGAVGFENEDVAKTAIKTFKDELEWYFRNYAPMPNDWYN